MYGSPQNKSDTPMAMIFSLTYCPHFLLEPYVIIVLAIFS